MTQKYQATAHLPTPAMPKPHHAVTGVVGQLTPAGSVAYIVTASIQAPASARLTFWRWRLGAA